MNERPQIILVEPCISGSGHSVLYAGVVKVLSRSFPRSRLTYIGERNHLEHVASHLEAGFAGSIHFVPLHLVSNRKRLAKLYFSINLRRLIKRVIGDSGAAYVLLLSTTGPEYFFISSLAGHRRPDPVYVDVLIHGPNRGNFLWRSRNPLLRSTDLVAATKLARRYQSRLLVLDRRTISEWERLCPTLHGLLGPLEITLTGGNPKFLPARRETSRVLQIGFLGQATRAKGFLRFVTIAKYLTERFSGRVQFHLIGRLSAELAAVSAGPVRMHTTGPQEKYQPPNQMSRAKYVDLIRQMDYICLPYEGDYYRTGASGVFFDAVEYEKPIIGTRFPMLESAFAEFGPLGILCDSDEEMIDAIAELLQGANDADYEAFQANLARLRAHHSPDAVAQRFLSWLTRDRPSLYAALTQMSV